VRCQRCLQSRTGACDQITITLATHTRDDGRSSR
jgi:hypothetical protein